MRGFRELVDDIAEVVRRPVLSISTNGTLIDEPWAERLVETPFANVTISIDGGTAATYNRLRRGADLDLVLANIERVNRWKARALRARAAHLDSFFVVMRSNFREIPQYLELMAHHQITDVSLQTMEISPENSARAPTLEADESISSRNEVHELHGLLRQIVPRFRTKFRMIRMSGLRTLFEAHGLDGDFLCEGEQNLYPDSDDLAATATGFDLCPNPWTTLFLVENGDAHLCFLSQPIGNLYCDSLSHLWNSPRAIAKRCDMIAGRYLASGCSPQYCGWREGKASPAHLDAVQLPGPLSEMVSIEPCSDHAASLALVRRLVKEEERKRLAAEQLARDAEARAEKAIRDFYKLDAPFTRLSAETPGRSKSSTSCHASPDSARHASPSGRRDEPQGLAADAGPAGTVIHSCKSLECAKALSGEQETPSWRKHGYRRFRMITPTRPPNDCGSRCKPPCPRGDNPEALHQVQTFQSSSSW